MSERQNRKIYQIPWQSFVGFLLGIVLLSSSNTENLPKFLLSLSLPLQWWFTKLSILACTSKAQAAELRRTHSARPPPKPNSNTDPRLHRKQIKVAAKHRSKDIADCHLRAKVVLFPLFAHCLAHYLLRCQELYWPIWIVGCIYAVAFWSEQVIELVGIVLDTCSNQTNKRPTLHFTSTRTKDRRFKTSAAIYTVPDGTLLDWASSLWSLLLVFKLLEAVCSYVGGLEASFEFVKDYTSIKIFVPRVPPFHWLFKFAISIPLRVMLFTVLDVPAALKDVWEGDRKETFANLKRDLDELLGINRRPQVWNWLSNCLPNSGLQDPVPPDPHSPDSTTPQTTGNTTFESDWSADHSNVSIIVHYPWRIRRWLRRANEKFERKVAKRLEEARVNESANLPSTDTNTSGDSNKIARRFLRSFNPAKTGLEILKTSRYDHRVAPRKKRRVSVNLKDCLRQVTHQIVSNVLLFPAYEEFVYNSFGPANLPLIVDTGASCCVTPLKDDFIPGTYKSSKVKIKDLSGSNTVAGKGMIRWAVKDKFGRHHCIEIEGYHVPQASVRLLSPQTLYKKFGGNGWQDENKYTIKLKQFGVELDAPYGLANLPILPMEESNSEPKNLWCEIFLVEKDDVGIWQKSILDASNQNLSAAQKELLLWHHKVSHAGLSKIHNLCRKKKAPVTNVKDLLELRDGPFLPCTHNVPNTVCDHLLCAACQVAKATRRKPTVRVAGEKLRDMVLKENHLQPGDCVSCDHYLSPTPGRIVASSGYSSTTNGYAAGTIYVDHASGYIFHQPQKSVSAAETIRGKLVLEREAADVGVTIKAYHSDNGVFASKEFREHCENLNQKLDFSGVGAKHQNGVAENAIKTVCNMARANMIHAVMHWPRFKFLTFWPQAMSYAIWCHNRLPSSVSDWSPEELWSRIKSTRSTIKRAHVFGCPVFVLDPRLQDDKSIPKWDSKARLGVFVGYSHEHSSTVPLIYNPSTQHISPQYHVIFDDSFSTISSFMSDMQRAVAFERLFETESREFYVNPSDAEAGRVTDSYEKTPRWATQDSEGATVDAVSEGGRYPIDVTSEGAVIHTSEGAESEGAEADCMGEAPQDSSSKPRRSQRLLGRLASVAIAGLYTAAAANPFSSEASWVQRPATVANVGTRYAARASTVKREYINEAALLSEDWNTISDEIAQGIGNLAAYLEPDLFDELEAYTVTNVQPHVLLAKTKSNPEDYPSYTKAVLGPNGDKWDEAIDQELETLEKINAWTLVRRTPGMKVLPMTWALRLKRFPDGLAKKFKARFCVCGNFQVEGIDFFETWAPVVQWTTVRAMMILASKMKLCTAQADITAAFVHAPLDDGEEIYVHQPMGRVYGRPGEFVLKLNRSVYGIRQAPRNFFQYLVKHFESEGLMQSENDPCLFVGKTVTAIVYVDDILFFSKSDDDINKTITNLHSKGIDIRREGTAEGFLGVAIDRVSTGPIQQIKLTQAGLAKRVVEALGLCSKYSTTISTPAEAAPLPKDVNGDPPSGTFNYAAVVGMLLYLSGHSRPDIAFAVHQCARYTFKPTRRHELALIRIGRYLKGTMDKGIIMTPTAEPRVDCYPDADFATCTDTKTYTTPIVFEAEQAT